MKRIKQFLVFQAKLHSNNNTYERERGREREKEIRGGVHINNEFGQQARERYDCKCYTS